MINLDFSEFSENEENNIPKSGTYLSKCSQIVPLKKYNVVIPKIIFQTWKTHDVPEKWKISPESIKALMSDWKYVLSDDEENRAFVSEYFPDFLSYYDAFPYNIQRADAIRYCKLYIHGGIYADLDFELQQDLSVFFQTGSVFLVKSGNIGSYFTNSFMASRPREKFWLEVIEEMKKPLPFYCIGRHFGIMLSTGPLMLSRVANKTDTVISVLPAKRIMPCSVCNLECSTCEAYLRPLEGSSWTNWETTVLNIFLCHGTKMLIFLIIVLFLLLIAWILNKLGLVNDALWPPTRALDLFISEK